LTLSAGIPRSSRFREAVERLQNSQRLRIRTLSGVSYEEVRAHFGRSRVYIGLGISDAISTAVLESMVMGCFPIQTKTSCCNEWFSDAASLLIYPI